MEIADSARKHGITDADILHAVDHALRYVLQEYDGEERLLLLGPAHDGALLELVLIPALGPNLVIHADRMRSKFLRLLR